MVKALKIFKIKMRIWLVWKPSPKLDSIHQNLVKQSHNRASYIYLKISFGKISFQWFQATKF